MRFQKGAKRRRNRTTILAHLATIFKLCYNYIMKKIPDRFNLSREDNVFVAKKYLKDSVYRSAFLEGIAVTFPQTEAILDAAEVSGVSARDISKVCGIRDGWRYILDNLDATVDLQMLEEVHAVIAREDVPWDRLGKLRTEGVRISGTNYLPELPNPENIHQDIIDTMKSETSDTDKAVNLMLYIMRVQPFLDGNKRVGTLICNKVLVSTGHGIFSLPPELKQEFSEKLVRFYEHGDSAKLKKLIFENCLTGLE